MVVGRKEGRQVLGKAGGENELQVEARREVEKGSKYGSKDVWGLE